VDDEIRKADLASTAGAARAYSEGMGGGGTDKRPPNSSDWLDRSQPFGPPDPEERLPGELVRSGGWYSDAVESRDLRRRIAALLWIPVLAVVLLIASWLDWNGLEALVALAVLISLLVLFAEYGGGLLRGSSRRNQT
jgi:hypothetical protein